MAVKTERENPDVFTCMRIQLKLYTSVKGVRSSGRQTNWATRFGQLDDNIGRVIKGIGTPVEKIIQSVDLFFPSTINSFAYCISTR